MAGVLALVLAIIALVQAVRVKEELERVRAELRELRAGGATAAGPGAAAEATATEPPLGGSAAPGGADRGEASRDAARAPRGPEAATPPVAGPVGVETPARTPPSPPPLPSFLPREAGAPAPAAAEAAARKEGPGLDLETRVGTTWALRLGLGALAIAVSLFARSVVPALGAGAKVALAYGGAVALFAVGRAFEARQERFARPVMAAALAIGFFVSFASYFVPAMRAVPLVPALAWMAAGVVAILVLAERWESEPTAGLAVFLGHVSAFVAGGVTEVYALVVVVFLSAAAVALLWRHDWLPLSLFAVTAAYGSHLLWALADRGPAAAGVGAGLNLLFLVSYYAIFLGADLIWWRGRRGASAAEHRLARALGPANLVLLASVAAFQYFAAGPAAVEITGFFFVLGALQFGLAPLYRRLGNPDHAHYPALGAVLLTLGLAAWLDGLTLNLVLGIEAVALLVAAHASRLRVFHLLAQAALAANFVHYWAAARHDDPTLAAYVGALAIVAAYLAQAVLEERWYGAEGGPRRGPRPAGLQGSLARAFDGAFGAAAPLLGPLHAAAAAVLLTHQSLRYLGAGDAVLAMAAAAVVTAMAALALRSVALLMAAATLQPLIALVAAGGPLPVTRVLVLAAVGMAVPIGVAAAAGARGFTRRALASTVSLTQLGVLAALLLPLTSYVLPEGAVPRLTYLAMVAVVGLAAVYLECARAALRHLGEPPPELVRAARAGAAVTAVLVTVALLVTTYRLVGEGVAAPVWTTTFAAILVAAAAWRRQPAFTLAGLSLLLAGDVYWLVAHVADDVVGSTPVAAYLAGVPLLAGLAHDRLGARRLTGARPRLAALGVHASYLLGGAIALGWCEVRLPEGWSSLAFAAVAAALVLLTAGARERRGAAIAVVLLLAALADQLAFAVTTTATGVADLLAPGLLLATAGLALERALAAGPLAPRWGSGGRMARLWVILAATGVAMASAHGSWWLGGPRTTAGWSLIGGALMALGFAARSADHRRVALAILGIALVRVFAVDTRGLTDSAKTVAFLVLGLSLVAVAWLYSRFGRRIRDWL